MHILLPECLAVGSTDLECETIPEREGVGIVKNLRLRRTLVPGLLVILSLLLAACAVTPISPVSDATSDKAVETYVENGATDEGPIASSESGAEATSASAFVSDDGVPRPAGWDDATHSNQIDPDYAAAYPQGVVTELRITIDPEQWQIMREDITGILGELREEGGFGSFGGDGMPPMGDGFPFDPENLPEGFPFDPENLPEGFPFDPENLPEGMSGFPGFGGSLVSETPAWVEATIEHDGNVWTHVGIRYKGNSSLRGSWFGDGLKLPFKLDFDEWEDDYPEIDNQRFYGFKELSLANNFSDDTGMRDALAYDVLGAAGLPAGETTFYNVILNYGEGDINLGLCTSNEVVDETVIPRFFGSDDGNIYEAEGSAASLAEGVRDAIPDAFEKKNNEDEADWRDIEELYDMLHSDLRTTDPEAWQAELESIFNVDQFLNFLAVAGVINHWDTYGQMTHNFYLYDDPATGLLNWISWDHNLTFGSSGMGGMARMRPEGGAAPEGIAPADAISGTVPADVIMTAPQGTPSGDPGFPGGQGMPPNFAGRMGGQSASSTENLARENSGDQWPLITLLLEIPEYREAYEQYIANTLSEGFVEEEIMAKVDAWAAALKPYADAENGDTTSYAESIETLKTFITERAATVAEFVAGLE